MSVFKSYNKLNFFKIVTFCFLFVSVNNIEDAHSRRANNSISTINKEKKEAAPKSDSSTTEESDTSRENTPEENRPTTSGRKPTKEKTTSAATTNKNVVTYPEKVRAEKEKISQQKESYFQEIEKIKSEGSKKRSRGGQSASKIKLIENSIEELENEEVKLDKNLNSYNGLSEIDKAKYDSSNNARVKEKLLNKGDENNKKTEEASGRTELEQAEYDLEQARKKRCSFRGRKIEGCEEQRQEAISNANKRISSINRESSSSITRRLNSATEKFARDIVTNISSIINSSSILNGVFGWIITVSLVFGFWSIFEKFRNGSSGVDLFSDLAVLFFWFSITMLCFYPSTWAFSVSSLVSDKAYEDARKSAGDAGLLTKFKVGSGADSSEQQIAPTIDVLAWGFAKNVFNEITEEIKKSAVNHTKCSGSDNSGEGGADLGETLQKCVSDRSDATRKWYVASFICDYEFNTSGSEKENLDCRNEAILNDGTSWKKAWKSYSKNLEEAGIVRSNYTQLTISDIYQACFVDNNGAPGVGDLVAMFKCGFKVYVSWTQAFRFTLDILEIIRNIVFAFIFIYYNFKLAVSFIMFKFVVCFLPWKEKRGNVKTIFAEMISYAAFGLVYAFILILTLLLTDGIGGWTDKAMTTAVGQYQSYGEIQYIYLQSLSLSIAVCLISIILVSKTPKIANDFLQANLDNIFGLVWSAAITAAGWVKGAAIGAAGLAIGAATGVGGAFISGIGGALGKEKGEEKAGQASPGTDASTTKPKPSPPSQPSSPSTGGAVMDTTGASSFKMDEDSEISQTQRPKIDKDKLPSDTDDDKSDEGTLTEGEDLDKAKSVDEINKSVEAYDEKIGGIDSKISQNEAEMKLLSKDDDRYKELEKENKGLGNDKAVINTKIQNEKRLVDTGKAKAQRDHSKKIEELNNSKREKERAFKKEHGSKSRKFISSKLTSIGESMKSGKINEFLNNGLSKVSGISDKIINKDFEGLASGMVSSVGGVAKSAGSTINKGASKIVGGATAVAGMGARMAVGKDKEYWRSNFKKNFSKDQMMENISSGSIYFGEADDSGYRKNTAAESKANIDKAHFDELESIDEEIRNENKNFEESISEVGLTKEEKFKLKLDKELEKPGNNMDSLEDQKKAYIEGREVENDVISKDPYMQQKRKEREEAEAIEKKMKAQKEKNKKIREEEERAEEERDIKEIQLIQEWKVKCEMEGVSFDDLVSKCRYAYNEERLNEAIPTFFKNSKWFAAAIRRINLEKK